MDSCRISELSEAAIVTSMPISMSSCEKFSLENIKKDNFIGDLVEFPHEDISGPVENLNPEVQISASIPDFAPMAYLFGGIQNCTLTQRTTSRTVDFIEHTLHNNKDAYFLPYTNTAEPDWFSDFNIDPSVWAEFTNMGVGEDSFFISHCKDAITESTIDENGTASKERKSNNSVQNLSRDLTAVQKRGLEASIPARPRSKRSRNGGVRGSSFGILSNGSDSVSQSSEDGTSFQSLSSSELIKEAISEKKCLVKNAEGVYNSFHSSFRSGESKEYIRNVEQQQPRRCTHCLTQKTPQWRIGPGGPKTLCNACGVRYNSGRLFPEYRPVKSPTFTESKHSNSHRKVMEIRRERAASMAKEDLVNEMNWVPRKSDW